MTGYRDWQLRQVDVAGRQFVEASKPGVFAYGRDDPSTAMLSRLAIVESNGIAVQMNCGAGLFGAVAAGGPAAHVYLTDRNVVNVDAARRTLAANDAVRGEVVSGHGSIGLPVGLRANTVAIRIPQEKVALRQLLWDAFMVLDDGGRCYVAGATNEGIKSAATLVAGLFGAAHTIAHHGGHRVLVARKQSDSAATPDQWDASILAHDAFNQLELTLRGAPATLFTRPGVFSWEHLDDATSILADAMEIPHGASVLDLGCGAGALGIVAARLSESGKVTMVDADLEAVRSATRSVAAAKLANCRVLASDIGGAVLEERFEVVVTNPPFHVGKATDLDVPLQFIRDAWQVLSPGGRLFLVANRTLPYERTIYQCFENISTLVDERRFKVLSAVKT